MKKIRIGIAGGLLFALVAALSAKAQESRLDQMVAAAIGGPGVKRIKFVNHEFNVKPAKITDRVAGITKIEGQISHHLNFRPDQQFYYLIEKQNGKIIRCEFKIDGDELIPYEGKLAREIPNRVAPHEIAGTLRKLGKKLDGGWESEAELIAYAIALRVDPLSHRDRVKMPEGGQPVAQHHPPFSP